MVSETTYNNQMNAQYNNQNNNSNESM